MSTLEPLFKLQKKAVRLVNNSHYIEHTAPIFDSLKILTVYQTFKLNCLIFIYKCIKNDNFPEFKKRLIKHSNIHSYSTRNKDDYKPPAERLELCKRSYFVQGIHLWNSLKEINSNITTGSTFNIFKQNAKKLLLQKIIV